MEIFIFPRNLGEKKKEKTTHIELINVIGKTLDRTIDRLIDEILSNRILPEKKQIWIIVYKNTLLRNNNKEKKWPENQSFHMENV
ncbi:hypothetical protein DERP_013586 [Dermatophagoides pteronyssinus]|uniref:Uncharacterized protein n=1 Tax=Dermatophagoides pteronyssinus TaxID=6956 RepID=A0ABQ8J5I6_DERPT|nr:hypothetical protein DERP_013586 [Dermatophagoides pteronyssinus]